MQSRALVQEGQGAADQHHVLEFLNRHRRSVMLGVSHWGKGTQQRASRWAFCAAVGLGTGN